LSYGRNVKQSIIIVYVASKARGWLEVALWLLQSRLTSPGLFGVNLTRITQMGRIPRKLKRIRVFRYFRDIRVESFLTLLQPWKSLWVY